MRRRHFDVGKGPRAVVVTGYADRPLGVALTSVVLAAKQLVQGAEWRLLRLWRSFCDGQEGMTGAERMPPYCA
jgi:hypothetical protein